MHGTHTPSSTGCTAKLRIPLRSTLRTFAPVMLLRWVLRTVTRPEDPVMLTPVMAPVIQNVVLLSLHESERSKAILHAPRRRRGRGAHGQGGELLLAKSRVSRAPPTRAEAPGLVARLPALEDDQEHSRGRRTGTRRPEMLRAERDSAGELQRALGRGGAGGAEAGVRQADQRGAATHGHTLPGTGSRRRKPSMCAGNSRARKQHKQQHVLAGRPPQNQRQTRKQPARRGRQCWGGAHL